MISAFRDVQIIAAAPAGIDLHAAKTKVSERGLNGFDCVIFACMAELFCRHYAHRPGLPHPSQPDCSR